MLTKNYYKVLEGCFAYNPIKTSFVGRGGTPYEVYTYSSDDVIKRVRHAIGFNKMDTLSQDLSSVTSGIVLGTGTAEPTLEDYYLSGDMVTGVTAAISVSFEDVGGAILKSAVLRVTNGGAEPITIGEVAYFHYMGQGSDPVVMLDRTVLEVPITIAPAGIGQVTYTIRMNYPV